MGPKTVGPGKVYFLKSTGDAVDITEYIMEGGFSMNTDRDKYIQRDEVLDFVQNVLGINPEIVQTIVIRENTIDVELVTLHIVD